MTTLTQPAGHRPALAVLTHESTRSRNRLRLILRGRSKLHHRVVPRLPTGYVPAYVQYPRSSGGGYVPADGIGENL
jgi:hypothetical protein